MPAFARGSFYRNLDVKRCLLMSSPFWLAAIASQDLNAVTYNVSTMAGLRAAIDSTNASTTSDIIVLAAGTYTLTGAAQENSNASGDLDITKATGDLVIQGAGSGGSIINGNSIDRCFHINSGSGFIVLQGLVVQNGRAADNGSSSSEARGGGILVQQGNLALHGTTVSNCAAQGANGGAGAAGLPASGSGNSGGTGGAGAAARGGAIYLSAGTVQILNSTFSSNTAVGGAGGAGGRGGDASVAVSSISSLLGCIGGQGGSGGAGGAGQGGAIYSGGGTLSLTSSTISGGSVTGGLGAAGGEGGDGTGSNFSTLIICVGGNGGGGGNGGAASGGAIYVAAGSVTLENSTLSAASAASGNGGNGGNGGDGAGSGLVINIRGGGGNGGSGGASQGGGLGVSGGSLAIYNSTVHGHSATGASGGAGGALGGGSLTSSPAGSNGSASSAQGGGIYSGGGALSLDSTIAAGGSAANGPDIFGNVTAGASLIQTTAGAVITSGTGANVTGVNPQLGALAANGGPTNTMAIAAGSPALDVGSNPQGLASDQRGSNRVSGGAPDIGAFEFQTGAGGQTANPTVTNPATPVTVNAGTFNVQGTAAANSLVRVYSDLDNNGAINGADAVVGSHQLTGGATSFSVSVPLTQDATNNFTATADDPTNTESGPVNVPTITEDSTAPAGPVVTTPAAPVNTTGATFNIIGTAEANALVQIYNDANNNGVIDAGETVVASGTATGGNFNISTPISLGTANNFTATAEDATGNESGPTDVPTITETSAITNPPVVTTPSGAVTVNQATFDIQGTAVADSLVRIYSDANNNGLVDGADAVLGSQQLTGGGTAFSINVTLTQNAANNFTATADDATNPESNAVNVPTITDNAGGGGGGIGGGGGGGGGGGCVTADTRHTGWVAIAALLATLVTAIRQCLRRKA